MKDHAITLITMLSVIVTIIVGINGIYADFQQGTARITKLEETVNQNKDKIDGFIETVKEDNDKLLEYLFDMERRMATCKQK